MKHVGKKKDKKRNLCVGVGVYMSLIKTIPTLKHIFSEQLYEAKVSLRLCDFSPTSVKSKINSRNHVPIKKLIEKTVMLSAHICKYGG